jgi:hypothetical protein
MIKHFYPRLLIASLMLLLSMLTFKSSAQTNTFPATGPVGIGTVTPASGTLLHIDGGGLLMTGTIGSTPIAGGGTRLMWIPAKAAFRAGSVSSIEWDDASIGLNSFALGSNNTASGSSSSVFGLFHFVWVSKCSKRTVFNWVWKRKYFRRIFLYFIWSE